MEYLHLQTAPTSVHSLQYTAKTNTFIEEATPLQFPQPASYDYNQHTAPEASFVPSKTLRFIRHSPKKVIWEPSTKKVDVKQLQDLSAVRQQPIVLPSLPEDLSDYTNQELDDLLLFYKWTFHNRVESQGFPSIALEFKKRADRILKDIETRMGQPIQNEKTEKNPTAMTLMDFDQKAESIALDVENLDALGFSKIGERYTQNQNSYAKYRQMRVDGTLDALAPWGMPLPTHSAETDRIVYFAQQAKRNGTTFERDSQTGLPLVPVREQRFPWPELLFEELPSAKQMNDGQPTVLPKDRHHREAASMNSSTVNEQIIKPSSITQKPVKYHGG
jgi:hypothetical protein